VPFEEDRSVVVDTRAGHHQDLAAGQQRGGTIGDVKTIGKVRPRCPGTGANVVDGSVTGAGAVRSGGEDRTVGTQHSGTYFIRAVGIPELHDGAAGAGPGTRAGVVDFGVRAVGVVLIDVGVNRDYLSPRKQIPSLLVVFIELARTSGSPGESGRVQKGLLLT